MAGLYFDRTVLGYVAVGFLKDGVRLYLVWLSE